MAIKTYSEATIALTSRGNLYCWGWGSYYACMGLDDGSKGRQPFTPVRLPTPSCVTSFAEGSHGRFVLDHEGSVWSWGVEFVGEFGNGDTEQSEPTVPHRALLPGPASALQVQTYTALAWIDGAPWAWGVVWPREFPDVAHVPYLHSGGTKLVHEEQVCDLDETGRLRCMGKNDFGAVGDGTLEPRYELVDVATDERFDDVWMLSRRVFARTLDGRLFAWGNSAKLLGVGLDDPEAMVLVPTEVPGLVDVEEVFLDSLVGCATDSVGTVRCWGLGTGDTLGSPAVSPTPREVPDFSPALDVALGYDFACALKTDHTVWCRGRWENRGQPQFADTPNDGPATRVVFPFESEP